MGMSVGYARVSSSGQKLDLQMDRLADCDRIYHEKASAANLYGFKICIAPGLLCASPELRTQQETTNGLIMRKEMLSPLADFQLPHPLQVAG